MARTIITVAVALCIASPVLAEEDTDYPHRDWGQVATLDMTRSDATACVTQGMARMYERILPVPLENGADIDAGPGGGLFGVAHDPWMRLKVREESGVVTLRVFYRHPVSQKQAGKTVERLQRRCLKVTNIAPVADINQPNQ